MHWSNNLEVAWEHKWGYSYHKGGISSYYISKKFEEVSCGQRSQLIGSFFKEVSCGQRSQLIGGL